MEYDFPLFDPNDETARQEERLREYYEEFSANARRRLLSKTINRPTSVYDVLYPDTRKNLLSKNVPFDNNIEESSKVIRDKMISKIVSEETSLEKISEDFRNSMLARAKVHEDKSKLINDSDIFRKNLTSKNVPTINSIESASIQARENNIVKNNSNISTKDNIDKNSDVFRSNSIAKNVSKEQDLLKDSESIRNQFRKNDIHKNVVNNSSLEKDSIPFRVNNIQRNTVNNETIDSVAELKRANELAKNNNKKINLEEISSNFRINDLSKNVSKEQDLLKDSESIRNQFRKNDIHKNVSNNSDIQKDNVLFRKNNLVKNVINKTDLEIDSIPYRNKNIKIIEGATKAELDLISEINRENNISKNIISETDLEKYSTDFRKQNLSNNIEKTNNIQIDSVPIRMGNLSKNIPTISNIELDSENFRKDDLSANKPKSSDLEKDSTLFRENALSNNVFSHTDLEQDSIPFRLSDLSVNKPKNSNLEQDSIPFREEDLSANKPKNSNLEQDSIPFREEDLSANKPKNSNLEQDSIPFRISDLSYNVPSYSNIESDSITFRNDDLSLNVLNITNIDLDSIPFRTDNLAANVPSNSDIATDSTPYLYNNLSLNTPGTSDIETDSIPFRTDDLSANIPSSSNLLIDSSQFREDDLALNILSQSDLETDSVPFRTDDLSANVPSFSNIEFDSVDFRENNLSSNVSNNSNLLQDSETFRVDAVAKNAAYGLLGINVEGAGTSAFLGISRVFTQGILLRQLLLSKNHSKNQDLLLDSETFRSNNVRASKWNLHGNAYDSTPENYSLAKLMQGPYNGNLVDYTLLGSYPTPTAKGIFATDDYNRTKGRELQLLYGTSQYVDFPTGRRDRKINNGVFSVNTLSSKGGDFGQSTYNRDTWTTFLQGNVTGNIRKYNQEKNAFNLHNLQAGDPSTIEALKGYTQEGFQELISLTIGSFNTNFQARTNTTPSEIISKNEGAYFKGGNRDMDIMRPEAGSAVIGSAESMMAKTVAGNPFEDTDFLEGKRGVRHVVDTIKKSNTPLAKNYDPQNNKAYIIGQSDGKPKISRQKYTIANPYAPQGAGRLTFYLKNYASGEDYYFPAYIKSFQNTENASWNSVNFLGRPEAMYTYNNSSRDGSISFYVLTDYGQQVTLGTNWGTDALDKIDVSISTHFTNRMKALNDEKKLEMGNLEKEKKEHENELRANLEKQKEIRVNSSQVSEAQKEISGSTISDIQSQVQGEKNEQASKEAAIAANESLENQASDALSQESDILKKQIKDLDNSIQAQKTEQILIKNYSEQNANGQNTYFNDVTSKELSDSKSRILNMIENSMFQPAFFSGDKVDFVRKIEFLSKMTRPSASPTQPNTGFSFTKPPICHIRLGDWWHHDIVVNSVSFDYDNAPWTLDDTKRVQPMWAIATISFNIIGSYGFGNSRPPLAGDNGGMYSPRVG